MEVMIKVFYEELTNFINKKEILCNVKNNKINRRRSIIFSYDSLPFLSDL